MNWAFFILKSLFSVTIEEILQSKYIANKNGLSCINKIDLLIIFFTFALFLFILNRLLLNEVILSRKLTLINHKTINI